MTILKGKLTRLFFQDSPHAEKHLKTKGNGVDVAALEIWRISDEAVVTIAGTTRQVEPPKERVFPVQRGDGYWFYLSKGKYEAVLPKTVIPDDAVILAFPRSTFNRFHGFHMLPTALWDSGFSARGTLAFEVRVKELRFPVNEPLFQLVAIRAEQVPAEDLYQGHWQEKNQRNS
jgi:deoxycytidine triphosphate deaminase